MANLYKLRNQIHHYDWGSPDFIPRLMGIAGDGTPWAEMWMGNNSTLSSGGSLAEHYGALPFLFKLLAAEKPLSIQVHPNRAQAHEGFARENSAGLPLDAPNRNYKDANHKPEIICALTPFIAMCGFRRPEEINDLVPDTIRKMVPDTDLRELFGLSLAARTALTECVLSERTGTDTIEWQLMREFAQAYPGDPAIIAPLYLNVFRLEPGEAVFLPARVPHAYIHGFGVELMANSDNVLRGGLSAKHIDIPELMKVIDFNPLKPQIIKPEPVDGCYTYPTPCTEFSLSVMSGSGNTREFAPKSPSMCIVTGGEAAIDGTILKQGESAFIPAAEDAPLLVQGHYTLYIASVPQ